jgi:hypothetical protein
MIKEFSVHAKPRNNNAKIMFLILILIAGVGLVGSFFLEHYRGVVGVFALMILVTAILIYTKYISAVFYYDITFDYEETPIFVVRQVVGRRQTTLCRIGLADIQKIELEDKKAKSGHKTPKNVHKYSYAPTLFPKEVYRMYIHNRHETAEIVIEGTAEFADLLRAYAKEAKEAYMEEE